jgi:Bacterial PH domain
MESFSIAPATGRALWLFLLLPGFVLIVVIGLLGVTLAGARSARFEVSPDGLRLRGDFYGRLIPINQLQVSGAGARRIDFAESPGLSPQRRTMGTGLPGYQSGWFRLKNGESALLYLTDRSRAVYVPTTNGYSVVVSPADPERFVTALLAVTGKS